MSNLKYISDINKNNYFGFVVDYAKENSSDGELLKQYQQQRINRGFDNTELMSLDCTIVGFIIPRLKEFIRIIKIKNDPATPLEAGCISQSTYVQKLEIALKELEEYGANNKSNSLKTFFEIFQSLWI